MDKPYFQNYTNTLSETYGADAIRIWFKEPAKNFIEGTPDHPSEVNPSGHLGELSDWITALPIGNGRLGGLVFGGINEDLIKLNEETLWSGEPKETNDPKWADYLPDIQKLIFEGRYEEADQIAQSLQGPFNESYMPLGNLRLHFNHDASAVNYKRELILDEAMVKVSYRTDNRNYIREYFCSQPDDVMVIYITCNEAASVTFDLTMDSMLRSAMLTLGHDGIILKGKAPFHVEPNYMGVIPDAVVYDDEKGMNYEAQVKAIADGGSVWTDKDGLHIADSNSVMLIITAATSFNNFDKSPSLNGNDTTALCQNTLSKAVKKEYKNLKKEHVADFCRLFNRVKLSLEENENSSLPTDQRLVKFRDCKTDSSLYSLFFNLGRYLLISSSRPGNLPANLQGIWSDEVRPPWSSNWTLNINTQMNYWLAEVCNLPECHTALIDYIDKLRINGRKTAKAYCHGSGWATASNGDLWNATNPVGGKNGNPSWANWLMSGPWLCQHLWLHYEYSLDSDFLRYTAYPIMKECAEFILDALIEDNNGYLGISPGTSPERTFRTDTGQVAAVSFGTTMDTALTKELFSNVINACAKLSLDESFAIRLKAAYSKLLPYRIGRLGQLQEWNNDWDDPDLKDSHCSFLYGLYPGWQITPKSTPDLAEAARISLGFRDFVLQGWGLAWRINLWARLYDSKNSLKALNLLITKLVTPSLLGKIYPDGIFQIDANLGGTAGIAEMLLQSHEGYINILPALPREWCNGSVEGLKAKGGFTVDIKWQSGKITQILIKSEYDSLCKININDTMKVRWNNQLIPSTYSSDCILLFNTKAGEIYTLS